MPCYHLVDAWQLDSGQIVFAERGKVRRALQLPCGQCVGCRLERSRQWAVRCVHEAQLHSANCFVTLTYDDDHLPSGKSLVYRDFQLFMKRLRKKFGAVRFYMAGEYGDLNGRPHYHACIFGCDFSDRVLFKRSGSGHDIYISSLLSGLWPLGFCSVADVSFESAAYVARYIMKKVTGRDADRYYLRVDVTSGEVFSVAPEFNRMSLKPGIGADWFARYSRECYPHDSCVINGVEVKVPKYYDALLRRVDPFGKDQLEYERYLKSLECIIDGTPERLGVREQVALARLAFKKRSLEL